LNAKRLFPDGYLSHRQTFKVLFLSEGFVSEEAFITACRKTVEQLMTVAPFGYTRFRPSWIAFYRHFIKSNEIGPAIGSTAADTAFGSTWNPATRALTIDPARVTVALRDLWFPGEEGDSSVRAEDVFPSGRTPMGPTGSALIVLMPGKVGAQAVSGELLFPYVADDLNPYLYPYAPFLATTADGAWHQAVARVIASRLGVGSEEDGVFGDEPSAGVGRLIERVYPNLIYRADVTAPTWAPPADFKWAKLLDESQRAALRVSAFPASQTPVPNPDRAIMLFEGGAGFDKKVYRSAQDCIMRRKPAAADGQLKKAGAAFCPLCEMFLSAQLRGGRNVDPIAARRRTLSNQSLRYDEVVWETKRTVDDPLSPVNVVEPPPGLGPLEPYFEFKRSVGGDGLKIESVKVKNLPEREGPHAHHGPHEDVFESIEYTGFGVTYSDGTAEVLPISAGVPTLEVAVNGKRGLESPYHHGIKLTLVYDRPDKPPLRVEMAFVARGQGHDFEPLGVAIVVKIFPQIGLTWSYRAGAPQVKAFRACVRLVVTTQLHHEARNIANTFADSNNLIPKFPGELANLEQIPLPPWSVIFDYCNTDIQKEVEFVGVVGPEDGERYSTTREFERSLITGVGFPDTTFEFSKIPRQAAYDNLHLHGYMKDDKFGRPMVHAPACGEACFHLHWRWGAINSYLAGGIPGSFIPQLGIQFGIAMTEEVSAGQAWKLFSTPYSIFEGWGHTPGMRQGSSVPGAPLIPPNQRLTVCLAHPDTRPDPSAHALGGPVLAGTAAALDPLRKAVWYTVDVFAPGPGERQVLLEQGCAWAFDYTEKAIFDRIHDHDGYEHIRYMDDLDDHQEIPEGDTSYHAGIKLEDL
jgi:hypothetical protein